MALRAWPRLSEYFARFQLSLGLPCSFEVMAPTLCSRPLFVRSSLERQQQQHNQLKIKKSRKKNKSAADDEDDGGDDEWDPDIADISSDSDCSIEADEDIRIQIQRAVSGHVSRNIDIRNVAHSMQPIRNGKRRTKNSPMLEVDMIAYKKSTDEEETEETDEGEMPSAQMTLVRMVNRIPLLDGAEAAACGLVQSVATKKSIWTTFGLSIQHGTDQTDQDLRFFTPTYSIRDSDSVSSFFQSRNPLYEMHEEEYDDDDEQEKYASDGFSDDGLMDADTRKRKARKTRKRKEFLLPAHLRLGNILLIVQIHAKPSSLPLPTLSKSRLPMNATAIDNALESGVMECLQSLQRTNPIMLLTAKQLKMTVRNTRYIPAAAAAMARVLCHAKDDTFQKHFLKVVRGWSSKEQQSGHISGETAAVCSDDDDDQPELLGEDLDASKVGPWIEAKLHRICAISDIPKLQKRKPSTRKKQHRSPIVAPPPPCSPPSRQSSSGSGWGGMSPSPVKRAVTNKAVKPKESRYSMESLSLSQGASSPSDSLMDGGNESCTGSKEPKTDKQKANNGSHVLTREEDHYDDDEWW